MKILKIKIRSAQNVGKVWISRKKDLRGPIWGHLGQFFAWAGKIEKMHVFFVPCWATGMTVVADLLKDDDLTVCRCAAEVLGNFGPAAAVSLAEVLLGSTAYCPTSGG